MIGLRTRKLTFSTLGSPEIGVVGRPEVAELIAVSSAAVRLLIELMAPGVAATTLPGPMSCTGPDIPGAKKEPPCAVVVRIWLVAVYRTRLLQLSDSCRRRKACS